MTDSFADPGESLGLSRIGRVPDKGGASLNTPPPTQAFGSIFGHSAMIPAADTASWIPIPPCTSR